MSTSGFCFTVKEIAALTVTNHVTSQCLLEHFYDVDCSLYFMCCNEEKKVAPELASFISYLNS